MNDGPLGHYRPWIEDVRKEKPYQLEDRIEQLFHEKSLTGYSAWNRQYRRHHRRAALQDRRQGSLSIEPALNLDCRTPTARSARKRRRRWPRPSRRNLRPFTLITNTLAKDKEISDRWRGFEDVADARHLSNRVEPEVVEALVVAVRAAYPKLSHRYYALKAKWFGKKSLPLLGPQRAAAEGRAAHDPLERAHATVLDAYGKFSPKMANSRRRASSPSAGSTRRCARQGSRAPSRIRPCRRRILMCCSTIRASRAT